MKIQDLFLLAILVILIWKNNKDWTTLGGLGLIALSIPLFAKHIFFTAQHLVYFSILYFLTAIIQATISLYARRN